MKPSWDKRACGCIKANLRAGKVMIRCEKHLDKPTKSGRLLCYFDSDGIVRSDYTESQLALEVLS